MNAADRNRKLIAISQFLLGNIKPLRELKPLLVIDLDQLSGDELEEIYRLHTTLSDAEKKDWDLQRLETHFGRKITLIPHVIVE